MRHRRNIGCLTEDELHDLRETLAAMYALPASDVNSFVLLASFHGGPPTAYCRHGAPGFFTWHRAYLLAYENALRSLGCDVTLPYWDWSSGPSTGVPDACRYPTYNNRSGNTVANPLYSGPRAGGGMTERRTDIDTTAFDDLATSAMAAMSETTFTSFQGLINGVHGGVHVRTGGDMGWVPTASYDPIFFLHHANVDRLWAQWQLTHPGMMPLSEGTFELQPFNRSFSAEWQRGSDMDSTDALGYRYQRFCFILPPIRLWEVVQVALPLTIRDAMTSARLVLKADRMQTKPIEIRAFLNQPRATGRSKTIGNPAFVGTVGFLGHDATHRVAIVVEECPECVKLGHTREHPHHGHGHNDREELQQKVKERFDIELDLTAPLRAADRDAEEVSLKLVAIDVDGEEVPAANIVMEDIEIVVE